MTNPLLLSVSTLALLAALALLRRREPRLLLLALCLAVGGTAGLITARMADHGTPPLAAHPAPPPVVVGDFRTIPAGQLDEEIRSHHNQVVLLEFHADWCQSCLIWRQKVLDQPVVRQALTPYVLIRIDASHMDAETQAVLDRFGLEGLPALLTFDGQGREIARLRILGEMPLPDFLHWLRTGPATIAAH